MLVSGYAGDIAGDLPPWLSFDVKTYSAYMKAIDGLRRKIFSDTENIRVTLLGSTAASHVRSSDDVVTRRGKVHLFH